MVLPWSRHSPSRVTLDWLVGFARIRALREPFLKLTWAMGLNCNEWHFSVDGQGLECPVSGCFEQWPKQPRESGRSLDEEDFPRNIPVHLLKAALQKALAEAP